MLPYLQVLLLFIPYFAYLNSIYIKNKNLRRKPDIFFALYSSVLALFYCWAYVRFEIFSTGYTNATQTILGRLFPVLLMTRAISVLSPASDQLPTAPIVNGSGLPFLAFFLSLGHVNVAKFVHIFDVLLTLYKYGLPSLSSGLPVPATDWF